MDNQILRIHYKKQSIPSWENPFPHQALIFFNVELDREIIQIMKINSLFFLSPEFEPLGFDPFIQLTQL